MEEQKLEKRMVGKAEALPVKLDPDDDRAAQSRGERENSKALVEIAQIESSPAMFAVYEILRSAEMMSSSYGVDWYSVLQVPPSVESAAVEAQYRKLTSILVPIRKDFYVAELALKLIRDAYEVLSDPARRASFDQKKKGVMTTPSRIGGGGTTSQGEGGVGSSKWSAGDFAPEQVWAVYGDGADPMPRLYARVNSIASPSEVKATFLEPHRTPQRREEAFLAPLGGCGVFRAGSGGEATVEMSRFSHPVNSCERSPDGTLYRILPGKGEVWAVREGQNRGGVAVVVEVLSEFSEESGVAACRLAEVDGYVTIFGRESAGGQQSHLLVKRFSSAEMVVGFSHRIPASRITGNTAVPGRRWFLEPDALPPKFALHHSI